MTAIRPRQTITIADYTYTLDDGAPDGMRWDTPRHYEGQIVQRQFADAAGSRYQAGPGDEWMRVVDHSDRTTSVYRLGVLWQCETAPGVNYHVERRTVVAVDRETARTRFLAGVTAYAVRRAPLVRQSG